MKREYFSYKLWGIYCSFIVAMVLQTILFFPKMWNIYPSWVMLILIYWVTVSPYQVNIGTSFILGLILDIILHSILGVHALSLSILSYIIIRKIYIFKYLSIWVQSFLIIFLSLINQGMILLMVFLTTQIIYSPRILWNCIIDGSIWPIMVAFIRKIYSSYNNIK